MLNFIRWLIIGILGGLWLWFAVFNGWVVSRGVFRRGYHGPSIAPLGGSICAAWWYIALIMGDPHHRAVYLACLGVAALLDMGSIPYLLFTLTGFLRRRPERQE